jgi:hypothetical protein
MGLNRDLDDDLVEKVPFFGHTRTFLREVRKREPLKLTATGNLTRNFCREMADLGLWDDDGAEEYHREHPVMREEDNWYLHVMNILTRVGGLTKKRRGALSTTAKCRDLMDRDGPSRLYAHLFEIYAKKYNWGYPDGFPDSPLIQRAFGFSLLLAHLYGDEPRDFEFYRDRFLWEFPFVLEDFQGDRYRSVKEWFGHCHRLRTFTRFMVMFGLARFEGGVKPDREDALVAKTELLDRLIGWPGLPDRPRRRGPARKRPGRSPEGMDDAEGEALVHRMADGLAVRVEEVPAVAADGRSEAPVDEEPPTMEEWRELYTAAVEFRDAAPWAWMHDTDVFGVQDPETGRVGFCTVLGEFEEHFGLGVFNGGRGLDVLVMLHSGAVEPETPESVFMQDCLMASFEDRKYLDNEDVGVIGELGLRFRGRAAWPQFRSYRPGYFPWHITGGEARRLTTALRQALQVSLRVAEDETLLDPPEGLEDRFLVRVPRRIRGRIDWTDEWLEPPEREDPPLIMETVDRKRIDEILASTTERGGVWEIGQAHLPHPMRDGDQPPIFPRALMIIDRDTDMVLSHEMEVPPWERSKATHVLMEAIRTSRHLPNEIHISDPVLHLRLKALAEQMGVHIIPRLTLPALEAAIDDLSAHLKNERQ